MSGRTDPTAADATTWTETACARCGIVFRCGAHSASCWCDTIALAPEQRDRLAELRLGGCLCRACLQAL